MFEIKRPNVILIVLDTVRVDHLSCYGYSRRTTPNIDRIAREGALFENAFSTAPWTPPSHASIFTGKYPSHHGTLGRQIFLKANDCSLPRVLRKNGYETLGITSCSLLGRGSGFDQGFQHHVDLNGARSLLSNVTRSRLKSFFWSLYKGPDKGAFETNVIVENWLKRTVLRKEKARSPFFVFMNYFECHTPYDPPRPFKKRFCQNLIKSRLHLKDLILEKVHGLKSDRIAGTSMDMQKLLWIADGKGLSAYVTKQIEVSEEEWKAIKSWYDGEINYLDYQLGNIIEFLRVNDVLDNTLLVITSDNGENFGDYGLALHPLCLYDSLLRVPLIMRLPGDVPRGKRLRHLTSTVDILPTILDIARITQLNGTLDGRSLYPFSDVRVHDFVIAEYGGLHRKAMRKPSTEKLDKIDRRGKCIRNLEFKYIYSPDKEELYNIREDPLKNDNILLKHPKMADSLKKQLSSTINISYFGLSALPNKKYTSKLKNRLKDLGYI